jgi:hypothetical protein
MAESEPATDPDRRGTVLPFEEGSVSVKGSAMSSKSEKQTESTEAEVGVLAPASRPLRAAARRESPPEGRAETQLRARVAELEAQLVEVARCLADAETRTADRQTELDLVWGNLHAMSASWSWRVTKPIRSAKARLRRLF